MQIVQKSLACFFALFFGCLAATAQTPALLKDINNAISSSNPRGMTNGNNNTVFFSANDGVHGRELWKTGGTEASTVLVKDINPNGDANPANFCNVNGTVFFTANDAQQATELWKTDGTASGTKFVASILLGGASSSFTQLTACNGKLFFRGYQPVVPPVGPPYVDLKLFVSDGTTAGTKVLGTTLSMPQNLKAVGNTLFLSGISPGVTNGNQLIKTDGVTVWALKSFQFANETANDLPANFTNVNGTLYFSAKNSTANGRQIWKSDGTTAGTSPMTNTQYGYKVSEMTHVNGKVFFSGVQATPIGNTLGDQVFRLNGLNNVTQISASEAANLTAVNGALVYSEASHLGAFLSRVTVNAATGSTLQSFSNTGYPSNLTVAGTNLFFVAGNTATGRELWKFNAAGVGMVQDFVAGGVDAGISDLCAFGSDVLFASNGLGGNELRRGTTSSITTVRNIGRAGSFPSEFVKMGNMTFFAADNGISGRELWKTDGFANTVQVADIIPGVPGSSPSNLIVVTAGNGDQTLFFVAKDPTKGRELFKLENTAGAVPTRISDIIPNAGNAGIGNMTNVNGVLHFTASSSLPALGDQIYKVNTTRTQVAPAGGTVQFANNLVAMGSTLFFTQSPVAGPQLSKLVAGNALASLVKNFPLIAGGENPIPQKLTVVGTRLFFTAADASRGRELWMTNAGATNASPISDIIAGPTGSSIGNLVNFNGVLHFTAANPGLATGARIYKTNAGLSGIEQTGGIQSSADNLVVAGTRLFFTQISQPGATLHKLENGFTSPALKTFAVQDMPQQITAAGSKVFFTAATANAGRELWKSDGTVAGTVQVSDIRPGVGNANILEIRLCAQDLFFSANDQIVGQEPWKLANAAAAQGDEGGEREAIEEEVVVETIAAPQINVYPNPTANFVNVDLPQNEMTGTLSILSNSGQLVRSVQSSEGETSIQMDVQDLPKGVYLVRWVQSDDQIVVKKLIVQ